MDTEILFKPKSNMKLSPATSELEIVRNVFNDVIENNLKESIKPIEYFNDINGHYYLNNLNEKIYKKSSFASEYKLNEINGIFTKINDGREILMDEIGDYFTDEYNEKYYIKKYLIDELNGKRYFLNENQQKIYKSDPYASEYILDNNKMIKIKNSIPRESYTELKFNKSTSFLGKLFVILLLCIIYY